MRVRFELGPDVFPSHVIENDKIKTVVSRALEI